jgi:alkyl hydroperoxide reductase subunit AhpC
MTRSPIQVGHPAPKFTLPAIAPELDEITVRSDGFHGRWLVLLFYPRDFSFVCPTELTSFSARLESFLKYNCTLLAVSIDSLKSHREWMQTPASQGGVSGLRFALASDMNGQVCKLYNVWQDGVDLPNRGVFLIDPN